MPLDMKALGEEIANLIADSVVPLRDEIKELRQALSEVKSARPERGEKGADGKDGASVTVDDVSPLIAELVGKAVAEIPAPKDGIDGKDGANGADGISVSKEDVDEMVDKRVAEYVSQIAVPKDGADGRDAEPIDVKEVVAEILAGDELKTLVDLHVAESVPAVVAKHFEANPVQHGKDGRDGKDGDRGPEGQRGEKGLDGRDGLDVKDLFRADGGRLLAVMSDGTTKDLGEFVGKDGRDGANGKDGRDGVGIEDADAAVEDGEAVVRFMRDGKIVKEIRYPLPTLGHIGFWGAGMSAKAGELTTHDGHLWLAKCATSEAPNYQSKDWQLCARKGADGARGAPGKDYKPREPVKLKD